MIRSFDWRDVGLVRNLGRKGVSLHSQAVLTRGTHTLQDALRGYLAPVSRQATYVWRQNGAPRAFAQLQISARSGCARVRFLAPAGVGADEVPRLDLLEKLAFEAGARGNHFLVAEVDEMSPEFELLRQAGFAVYARQEIVCRSTLSERNPVDLPLRHRHKTDTLGVQLLYHNIVPPLVQQVESSPVESNNGYVLLQEGELVAYLNVQRGPHGVWVQPYLHPEAHTVIDAVLDAFLSLEAKRSRGPVYVCIRSYQYGLQAALSENKFEPWGHQAVMVKRLGFSVKTPHFRALPALDGTEGEIASPITETSISLQN